MYGPDEWLGIWEDEAANRWLLIRQRLLLRADKERAKLLWASDWGPYLSLPDELWDQSVACAKWFLAVEMYT